MVDEAKAPILLSSLVGGVTRFCVLKLVGEKERWIELTTAKNYR